MKIPKPGLVLFMLLLMFQLLEAQDVIIVNKTLARSYSGTIGQKKARMDLSVTNNTAKGTYVYDGSCTPMYITGKVDDNRLDLNVVPDINAGNDNGNLDGYLSKGNFSGTIEADGNISGKFTPEGNSNALDANLTKTFEVTYVDSTMQASFLNHNTELKIDTIYAAALKEVQFIDLPYRKKMRYINSWYSYPFILVMAKNDYKDLNSVGGVKLEEMGLKDGDYLVEQKKTYIHPQFPYHYENKYSVAYIDPHFLSMESDIYVFDGASHAFTDVQYKSYDLQTGDSLKLDSLFLRGGKYILDSVGEICFKKQLGLSPDADLATAGYYWNDSMFHVSNNFYFTTSGICFVYNQYEIAPYSAGIIKFIIPYDMLKPIIWKGGPLGWVFKD